MDVTMNTVKTWRRARLAVEKVTGRRMPYSVLATLALLPAKDRIAAVEILLRNGMRRT
jgi:hypothetical protein